MRRFDKNKNIAKVNLLSEQRYLKSKGLLNEVVSELILSTDMLINKIPFLKRFTLDDDSDSDFILFTYEKHVKDVEVSNQLFNDIAVHYEEYGVNIENFDVDVYFEIILRFDKNGYDYSVNLIPILQIKVKNEINDYGRFKIFMEKLIQHYEVEYPNLIKDKFSLHTEINKQNFDDKITEINKLLYKLSQQLDLKFGEFNLL
jgi:hypothetical protein